MDTYDATKMILTRIQTLDPENGSKIMGYILIQDLGDKELIRLAHGPENHLGSLINQAKAFLSTQNGGHLKSHSPSSPWLNSPNVFSRKSPVSYAAVVGSTQNNVNITTSSSSLSLPSDEFHGMSPSGRSDSVIWGYDDHSVPPFHRRSCSVNDAYLFEDMDGGGGQNGNLLGCWRPCMYFARGYCKNGSSCKFSHTFDGFGGDLSMVGSPKNMDDGFDWLRMKAIEQQRLPDTSKLIASGPRHSFPPFKRSTVAAMMGEEFQKFGPIGPDMNNFSGMGLDCNSSSRQIYLTFPADSPFTEEDVSNYFSMYGPVQDVRIPYQQKRMFGFVTFNYSETVNLILAKGNPHFVCDSRVLVKPYKEKGKVAEKKRQRNQLHLLDRGEFPGCLSPTGFDGRETYDLPFGGRSFYNAKEMMLKNKLEEHAELQQAIELEGRRLMNMHLMDLKNNYNNHQSRPCFPNAFSPTSRLQTHPQMFQNIVEPSDEAEVKVGDDPAIDVIDKVTKEVSGTSDDEAMTKFKGADLPERLEHNLPDSLFASPTKTVTDHRSLSVSIPTETDANYQAVLSSTCPTLSYVDSIKSRHFQIPRFPSEQGVVDM